jgi:hypothetical protein
VKIPVWIFRPHKTDPKANVSVAIPRLRLAASAGIVDLPGAKLMDHPKKENHANN